MAKEILPVELRTKVRDLIDQGYENSVILDMMEEEASPYVEDDEQLMRCINTIKAHRTMGHEIRTP